MVKSAFKSTGFQAKILPSYKGVKKQMKMVRSPLPANGTETRHWLRGRENHVDAFINRYFAEGPLLGPINVLNMNSFELFLPADTDPTET